MEKEAWTHATAHTHNTKPRRGTPPEAIVVPPCHFEVVGGRPTLCITSRERLASALHLVNTVADESTHMPWFVVTGDVPYTNHGTTTLATLARDHLIRYHVPSDRILIGRGICACDEAKLVTAQLAEKGISRFALVSSPWYLFYALRYWCKYARAHNQWLAPVSVQSPVGLRTLARYCTFALAVRLAFLLKQEERLAEKVIARLEYRRDGCTWNGCA